MSSEARLQKDVCSDEGKMLHLISRTWRKKKSWMGASVPKGGAVERTWEQTLAHSQIYSQLTGL